MPAASTRPATPAHGNKQYGCTARTEHEDRRPNYVAVNHAGQQPVSWWTEQDAPAEQWLGFGRPHLREGLAWL